MMQKPRHRFARLALLLGAAASAHAASPPPAPVPQSGQTNVYRIGDDGDHRAGVTWSTPRFISHTNATVTDRLTGLMWTRDGNPGGNKTWPAAVDFAYGLDFAGHDDWRLPNANEMVSLMEGQPALRYVGAHGGVFTNVQSKYWQSTLRPDGGAYFSVANAGTITHEGAGASALVAAWPVRDALPHPPAPLPQTGQTTVYRSGADGDLRRGVPWPQPRFTNNDDGTVTDNLTGLMWVRNANLAGSSPSYPDEQPPPPVGGNMTWYAAIDFCNTLEWAGHSDWRLPNLLELMSLQHWGSPSPSSGHGLFWYVEWRYWSSSSYSLDNAYYVHGLTVGAGQLDKHTSAAMYVWPVRGPDPIPPTGVQVLVH